MADDGATVEHVEAGISGHVERFDVFVRGDVVRVVEDVQGDPIDVRREIDGLGEFVAGAEEFRLGWAKFPDGDDVVYLYDKADDCFGYAVNLASSLMSEWGYAPFRD